MRVQMRKLLLLGCLVVTGCAVTHEPSEGNQLVTNIVVKLPPEQTYKNLVRAAKEKCFPLAIDAQFYPVTNAADVSFSSQFDGQSRIVWINIGIKPINEDSAVTLQYRGKKNEFIEPATKWMNGQDAKCPINMR